MSKTEKNKTKVTKQEDQSSEVNEADTDIEHVLKRLHVEEQKRRDKNFGLYR